MTAIGGRYIRKAGHLLLPPALALAACACSSDPRAPSFLSPVSYAEGSLATSMALRDLNGDGLTDVAVVLRADPAAAGTVSVLLNKGDGSLSAPVAYSTDAGVGTVAVGDLNGDGAADLAVGTDSAACALLNNGNGTFGAATCYPGGIGGGVIEAGDLNGDGLPDLAVAYSGERFALDGTGAGVSIFLNLGGGKFASPLGYLPVANQTFAIALAMADLNGDGRSDLVTADHWVGGSVMDGRASVFVYNNASGSFAGAVDYRVDPRSYGALPTGVAMADINGDRKADVALTYFDRAPFGAKHQGVAVLLGDGRGILASPADYAAGVNPIAVVTGDVNGDGETDLAVGNRGSGMCSTECVPGSASVLLNEGGGHLARSIDYALPPSLSPSLVNSIALGDLNSDGYLDLVLSSDRGVAAYLSAPR
jgi:hypothetical protein